MKNPVLLDRLAARLESLGLGPFLAGLLEAGAGPLGFLASQSLYVAQPTLGLFVDEARLAGLAHWLDDEAGLQGLAERMRRGGAED